MVNEHDYLRQFVYDRYVGEREQSQSKEEDQEAYAKRLAAEELIQRLELDSRLHKEQENNSNE